jgi:hypothetical protein
VHNGIEAALRDLKGKLLDLPVHALLGGANTLRDFATAVNFLGDALIRFPANPTPSRCRRPRPMPKSCPKTCFRLHFSAVSCICIHVLKH